MLLLRFPELKTNIGAVAERLTDTHASPEVVALWHEIVATEIVEEDDEDEFEDW